jgi:hypothetical protein
MDVWLRERLMTVRETDARTRGDYRDLLATQDMLKRRVKELENQLAQRIIDEAFGLEPR